VQALAEAEADLERIRAVRGATVKALRARWRMSPINVNRCQPRSQN